MKRLIVVLVLWVVGATPAWAEIDRAMLLGLSASVLKIEALRVQGGFSLGTGVVVAPERLVTNCHVTHDALKINVLRGGVRWLAVSQRSDVGHDLCLLRVPGLRASVVALGRADRLARGQPVTALGYSGGMGMQASPGQVLALHRLDGTRVIQSSNWFSSGASGGALFDEDLQLVGILTFRLRGGEPHSFAAPVEWLRALLDAAAHDDADIAPDRSEQLAYWQRPLRDQPKFLNAALLERDGRWPELESLANEWLRADASDPEPWYLLGLALAQTDRLPEARQALECALAIAPAFPFASARLASVNARQGLADRAAAPAPGTGAACAPGAPSSRSS